MQTKPSTTVYSAFDRINRTRIYGFNTSPPLGKRELKGKDNSARILTRPPQRIRPSNASASSNHSYACCRIHSTYPSSPGELWRQLRHPDGDAGLDRCDLAWSLRGCGKHHPIYCDRPLQRRVEL